MIARPKDLRMCPTFEDFTDDEHAALAGLTVRCTYGAGDWLFHESAPRDWFGIVEQGEVELLQGRYGDTSHLGIAGPGALLAEEAWLDEQPHTASAVARGAVTTLQVSREQIRSLRRTQPDLFYRVLARVARQVGERLRLERDRMAGRRSPGLTGHTRTEHDLLGEREIPDTAYYGIQTQRAVENFPLSGIRIGTFGALIDALAYVKKACAQANAELGVLEQPLADAISAACDEILAGRLRDEFVVDIFQGGAGTSTNMNANEVIANRGLEFLGKKKGEYRYLHPNDHVNMSQSTNDVYPTAIKLAVALTLREVVAGMEELRIALADKGREFADVLKMGRTENQDAVPMTLGQEFGAYAVMTRQATRRLRDAGAQLLEINMGATAIGTGINTPPGYADLVTEKLVAISGIPVVKARDLVEATQDPGGFVQISAAMKRAAISISKICNDLRWLSSGPRCGLGEIELPPVQPGSSIMPGKINPVIPEAVNQVCFQIIGNDVAITMAAEGGELELNPFEPLMAWDLLQGLTLLRNACLTLATRCIRGIVARRDQCRAYVEGSIGLVTALNPVIGYERSVALAKEALDTGRSVYELVLEKGWLSREAVEEILRPDKMVHPRRVPTA
ncbi:MAG TPA: aspartate ammonia-lyase [Bacillota bacterium]|nr:aspartate ammonia-lyase [Bacillota bacterium]